MDVKQYYLLTLLNAERKKYNSTPIYLDNLLNQISQAHC